MRFQRGIPHPPRGPGRKPYRITEAALRARRRNLDEARSRGKIKLWRVHDESLLIKLLVWQACFDPEPRPSQRALARKLRVWPSYVCKVQKHAIDVGWDALVNFGRPVTLDDLTEARRFTERIRQEGLLAPRRTEIVSNAPRVMTADDIQREAQELIRLAHRQNPGAQRRTMQDWQELERRGENRGTRKGLY